MLLDGNVTELLPKNRGYVCGWAISRTMLAHKTIALTGFQRFKDLNHLGSLIIPLKVEDIGIK